MPERSTMGAGPGRLLVGVYAVFAVAAGSRAAVQLATRASEALVAYALSAVAALVYLALALLLARGGERSWRLAVIGCCVELVGVMGVGLWSVLQPGEFPDATVWSEFGAGYVFIPLVLPVAGLAWLARVRHQGLEPRTR